MRPTRRMMAALGATAALTGCGGMTSFADTTPIVLASPVPPPAPVVETPRVEVQRDRIVINEKIQFAIDKAEILPESHGLLNEVVGALREHSDIKKLDIIGHTDDDGDEKYNLSLSERRAKAVMSYLIAQGIDGSRLFAKGLGETQPVADNTSFSGREQNRRVEFLILEQEGAKP